MRRLAVAAAAMGLASMAVAGTSWDLAGDYAADTNPNGAWSYGDLNNGGAFSLLPWNSGTNSYGIVADGQTFIYRNEVGFRDFGIDPGKVSLEADWGNPAVRWVAPSAGSYAFSVRVGGSTESGPGGFGNNFAAYAGLDVNGIGRSSDSFVDNVAAWDFTVSLAAGEYVQVFVLNPGFAAGGNTQTDILVSAVPEPGAWLLMAGGLLVLAVRRRRPS